MPRELVAIQPRKPVLREYEEKSLHKDEVRIKTEFSSPKHGTELHLYRGISPMQNKTFSYEYRAFLPSDRPGSIFPLSLGNMSVGTIIEIGAEVKKFKLGDKVFGHLLIRETHIVKEEQVQLLPSQISPEEAVCLDPAHFALAAIRDAKVRLGEKVAVFGLGAIGLIAVQMARLSGATLVVGSDPFAERRQLAEEYGADRTFDPTNCDVGLEIKKATGKRGVDVAIEMSGSYSALQDAIRSVHYSGLVITVSYYRGSSSPLCLAEEWHHNRITMVSSMPVWDNPSRDYPLWDDERLHDTVFKLMQAKKLSVKDMITPVYPFEKAVQAYHFIDEHPEKCIKLGIIY